MRVLTLVAAVGLAALPHIANACLYTQQPEEVGPASQQFFTQRMAQEAASVDIAVAGETRKAFGTQTNWGISATTFHVIDRLKGSSPDRFNLFVGASGPDHKDVQAYHWVDDQGRIKPYPYPEEMTPAADGNFRLTSCHPGFLSVTKDEAYLIFRNAQGRLLGRFALYDDLTTAAFPLVRASLGDREGWLSSLGPIAESTAPLASLSPTSTTIRFNRATSARDARGWLRAGALKPFAVRTRRGDIIDETRVPAAFASPDLLGRAFDEAASNERSDAMRLLASSLLMKLSPQTLDQDGWIRQRVWGLVEKGAALNATTGERELYEIEVTGTAEAIARLRENPGNVRLIEGPIEQEQWYVELQSAPNEQARFEAAQGETTESLIARLSAMANGQPIPEAIVKPPEPEPDPFSYHDCIRFGREGAARLSALPEIDQWGELTIFGNPQQTICTTNSKGISCDLTPSSTVRIKWAGWDGGFRIGPKGARLNFDGAGLQCIAP